MNYLYRSFHSTDEDYQTIIEILRSRRVYADYRRFKTGAMAFRIPMSDLANLPHDVNHEPYLPSARGGGYGLYQENNEKFYDEMAIEEWIPVIPRTHVVRDSEEGRFALFRKVLTWAFIIINATIIIGCIALFVLSR